MQNHFDKQQLQLRQDSPSQERETQPQPAKAPAAGQLAGQYQSSGSDESRPFGFDRMPTVWG